MNRKLGHQEQKREACYNQYILICGFKGDSIAKLWCFMWCLMSFYGFTWVLMSHKLCVISEANLLHEVQSEIKIV